MKGMLTKDLVFWKKMMPGYVFLLIIYAATTLIGTVDWMMFIVSVNIFLTLTSAFVDCFGKWGRTVVCFPIDRKTIVTSRYISAVITAAVSVVMVLISGTVATLFFGMEAVEMLYAVGFAVIYCFFFAAAVLFLEYKSETDWGRLLGVLLGYIAFIGGTIAITGHFFTMLRNNMSLTTIIITVFASAVLLFISWAASVRNYEKRDL